MSCSRHKVRLTAGVRDIRAKWGGEALVSELKIKAALEDKFQAGYEAGQKVLGEQLVQQRAQLIEVQTGVLASIERALPGMIQECEKSLVLLAMEAARRVVSGIPISAELIESTVKSALENLRDSAEYELLLHPEDLELLRQVNSSQLPQGENGKMKFTADATISRGGCVVRSHLGSIDATHEKLSEKLEGAVLC